MRLSYKTYPIWSQIESGRISSIDGNLLTVVKTAENYDYKTWLGGVCVASLESVRGDINFLTKPFRDAISKAAPKIISSTKEFLEKPIVSHILMHEGGGTIVFSDNRIDSLKIMLLGFDRNKIVAFGTMNTDNYAVGGYGDKEFLKKFTIHNSEHADDHQRLSDWFTYILITNYFIKNCEIEIKELKPKEKYRTKGEKHLNESKKQIRILDCTWFTTLISNIPQNVSGHFRWQACGKEFSQRKLIWIKDFVKNGFTRKAKVLNET